MYFPAQLIYLSVLGLDQQSAIGKEWFFVELVECLLIANRFGIDVALFLLVGDELVVLW